MHSDPKPRTDSAVPKPDGSERLSEQEKRAMELQGEVEHQTGREKEETSKKASDFAERDKR